MKKIILSAILAAMSFACVAQSVKLPKEYEELFNRADSTVSTTPYVTPVIGVPFGMDQYRVCNELVKAGAVPVVIPKGYTDINVYRDIVAALDGFVLPDDFSDSDTEALMLKAAADRNLPIYGSCELLGQINARYGRMNEDYKDWQSFIRRAASYKKAKAIMSHVFSIDSHSDLPLDIARGKASVGMRNRGDQVSIQKMTEGMLDSEVLIAYIGQGKLDQESLDKAFARVDGLVDRIYEDVGRYPEFCGIARTPEEALKLKEQGRKVFFIGVENAYGLGGKLANVKHFADRGAIYITLSHIGDNDVCCSSAVRGTSEPGRKDTGLTAFGRKVVADMNKYGLIIDVSHTSNQTFWDVNKYSKVPFVCSHSGAYDVFEHNRNISDEMLRALAKKGGVIQIYMVDNYMTADYKNANILTGYAHLKHCIEVAGIDHVGIGTDFDGGGGAPGWNGANDIINIATLMVEDGYSEDDIRKVMGGNFLRVMQEVQDYAKKISK